MTTITRSDFTLNLTSLLKFIKQNDGKKLMTQIPQFNHWFNETVDNLKRNKNMHLYKNAFVTIYNDHKQEITNGDLSWTTPDNSNLVLENTNNTVYFPLHTVYNSLQEQNQNEFKKIFISCIQNCLPDKSDEKTKLKNAIEEQYGAITSFVTNTISGDIDLNQAYKTLERVSKKLPDISSLNLQDRNSNVLEKLGNVLLDLSRDQQVVDDVRVLLSLTQNEKLIKKFPELINKFMKK